MSVLLALILVGVAAQPPALPPDPPTNGPAPAGDGATPPASTNEHADASAPATVEHGAQGDEPRADQPAPDSGPVAPPQSGTRPPLPAGLQPVPFPLEQTRATQTQITPQVPLPSQTSQRSIVDLRDPFSRPPTRPIPRADREAASLLLMPDLKDPFAPEVRRVRSQTLDQSVPNDIRDPFRDRPRPPNPPPCARGDNGVVVQTPGGECGRSAIDLRDPFSR